MARSPRSDRPGAWHHVMNRAAGRRVVFRGDREREGFVDLLAEFDDRFAVEVHAYCLMGNHFHLLVRSRDGALPDAMQWMSSIFTRRANRGRDVDGAVFRGRYHAVPVVDDPHLTVLARYIHRNPLPLLDGAPLAHYRWSSLPAYTRPSLRPSWLHTDVLLGRFGGDPTRLLHHVEHDGPPPPRRVRPAFGRIEGALRTANGLDGRVQRDALVRNTAMALAVDGFGLDRRTIGSELRLSSSATSTALMRGRKAIDDPRFRTWIDAGREMLTTGVTLGV